MTASFSIDLVHSSWPTCGAHDTVRSLWDAIGRPPIYPAGFSTQGANQRDLPTLIIQGVRPLKLCTPGAWSLSLAAIEPGLCRYAIEAAALAQLQCRSTQRYSQCCSARSANTARFREAVL